MNGFGYDVILINRIPIIFLLLWKLAQEVIQYCFATARKLLKSYTEA